MDERNRFIKVSKSLMNIRCFGLLLGPETALERLKDSKKRARRFVHREFKNDRISEQSRDRILAIVAKWNTDEERIANIKAYKEACKANKHPDFVTLGFCSCCGSDLAVEKISYGTTGCPHCNWSFCE